MTIDTRKSPRRWLPWIGLLLLGLVLIGMIAGNVEPSLALPLSQDVQVGKTVDVSSVLAKTSASPVGPASAELEVAPAVLTVTKVPSKTRLLHSDWLDYTVTFANSGQVIGTLERITDTLDAPLSYVGVLPGNEGGEPAVNGDVLTWDGPFDLAPGADLVLKYRVQTPAGPGWSWPCNKVEANAGGVTVTPAQSCVEVGPAKAWTYLPLVLRRYAPARFTISKSATPNEVNALPGQMVTYIVTIVNEGTEPGSVSAVNDILPAGFTWKEMVAGSDVLSAPAGSTGLITWSTAGGWQVAGGGQLRLIYKVEASQTLGTWVNQATAVVQAGIPPAGPATAPVTVKKGLLLEEDFEQQGFGDWVPFVNYPPRLEEGQWYWDGADGVNGSGAITQNCCAGVKQAEDALFMYQGAGAEQWMDYRVEAKVILRGGVDDGVWNHGWGYPIGLWVRGQYEPSETRAKWVRGYYVVVGGKIDGQYHWIRISKIQTADDCLPQACANPENLDNFNNAFQLIQVEYLPDRFTRDEYHTLIVEVRGANIKVWWDQDPAVDVPEVDFTDPKAPFLSGSVGFKAQSSSTASFDEVVVMPLQ